MIDQFLYDEFRKDHAVVETLHGVKITAEATVTQEVASQRMGFFSIPKKVTNLATKVWAPQHFFLI